MSKQQTEYVLTSNELKQAIAIYLIEKREADIRAGDLIDTWVIQNDAIRVVITEVGHE